MGIFDGLMRHLPIRGTETPIALEGLPPIDSWEVCAECGELDLSWDMRDDLCSNCSETDTCDQCGNETLASRLDDGLCENCFENQGNWSTTSHGPPSYCCGAMYDQGETECRSCGEPL